VIEILRRIIPSTHLTAPTWLVRCTVCSEEYRRVGWRSGVSKSKHCNACEQKKRQGMSDMIPLAEHARIVAQLTAERDEARAGNDVFMRRYMRVALQRDHYKLALERIRAMGALARTRAGPIAPAVEMAHDALVAADAARMDRGQW
jgi:hypothetical protein